MTTQQEYSETTSTLSEEQVNDLIEEATSRNYIDVIQTVIAGMDKDDSAMVSQTDSGHLWKFKYGSVEVFVQLTGLTDDDTLTVWSFVLQLPAKNEPQLMRKLLEMNGTQTLESRFCIINNQVMVLSTRTLAELSAGEISRIMTIVATIADNNDETLQAEFGQ
ncbi:YbjN domain-containing protein [Microcoleus sp. FACHB-831]|jgi:hypothetical protein|uniref:YbjN domain-containing protein n=1 Tax=Microcoleus sp. FACHB-831 TaxID=2692827 RepID=UPI0016856B25|nr:YbjN domain-containing protein [Microcoleus sp. FACHB-831]MBD1920542.1 YbjN domain-containing protein [Microcoleus sp. FACHB-831]